MRDRAQKIFEPSTKLCRPCAERVFSDWQGWPWSEVKLWSRREHKMGHLPPPPIVNGAKCDTCGSHKLIRIDQIYYQNYHGPYNTGLPDYFQLRIAAELEQALAEKSHARWGNPYLDDAPIFSDPAKAN